MTEQMSRPQPDASNEMRTQRITIKGLPAPEAFSSKTAEVTFDMPAPGETTREFNNIIKEGYNAPDADVAADPAGRFPKAEHAEDAPQPMTRAEAKKQAAYVGRGEYADDHIGRHRAGSHSGKENYMLSATVSEYIRGTKNAAARVLGALAAAKAAIIPKDAAYLGRHSTEGLILAERAQQLADESAAEIAQAGIAEGDSYTTPDGVKWEISVIDTDDSSVTLQRVDDDGEIVIDTVPLSTFQDILPTEVQTVETQTEAQSESTSFITRLRELPINAASRLTARAQQRHEKWAEMSTADKKEAVRVRVLGGAALAMAMAGAAIVARHYGMETSTGGSGSAAAADALGVHGTGNSLPLITDTDMTPKGGGNHLPLITDADLDVIPKEALKFKEGNGLFHVFNKLGIPKDKWHEVLSEVGPKLVDAGEAYPDKSIGGYGLVNDGKLTRSAARIIKQARALK